MASQIHSDLQRNISVHWTVKGGVDFVNKKTEYLVKAENLQSHFTPKEPPAEAGVEY